MLNLGFLWAAEPARVPKTLVRTRGAAFKIGMAGFSFWKTPLDEALATMKAIHNHGLDMPKLYLTAEAVMARVANRCGRQLHGRVPHRV